MDIFGYAFKDQSLLEEALTTPSFRMSSPGAGDNQRLEFLGDAVLGFLAAERLYAAFPGEPEGALTVKRTRMVSSATLCAAAARHDLASRLRRNKGASPLPENAKTLADAVEAVVGAAYLDGGLDAARAMFCSLGLEDLANSACGNPKGDLQIRAQAMVPPRHPTYRLLKTEGPAHAPVFTVEVSVENLGAASASAHSHKEAETLAAAKLLSMV